MNNLLTVSEAIALAALERKESRGAHFRDDYPEKDAAYATFNFVISKAHGRGDADRPRAAAADDAKSRSRLSRRMK